MIADYGDPAGEERAFADGAALVDRSARGAVLVDGPDALKFLQSLLSQDIATLADGQGAHALLLQPQGKLDTDLRFLRVGRTPPGSTARSAGARRWPPRCGGSRSGSRPRWTTGPGSGAA